MDGFVELIFIALLFVVLVVICVTVSVKKDNKKEAVLEAYLQSKGFVISSKTDIADMQNSGKPYKFLIDFTNKKWAYAKYRAETCDIYSFSDIVDYKVIINAKGTNILKGEKHVIDSDTGAGCGILKTKKPNENNCDRIAIKLEFKGKPASEVDTLWVMYENQESGGNIRHSDFLISSVCIESAVRLEQQLYGILCSNNCG